MQDLNISIRKARIEGFSVTLRDERPEVTATISLLTEGGKKITSYTIGSEHWEDNMKFHLPHEIVGPVVEIARILERVVADHCQSAALRLHAPTAEVRDRATFIPVLAVKLEPACEGDRYLFGRAGYGIFPEAQRRFIMVCRVDGGEGYATSDPYDWRDGSRTMVLAHKHIEEQFDHLESGAVIDVEFLLGETKERKLSERETAAL